MDIKSQWRRTSFIDRNQIELLVIAGFAGFITGFLLLFYEDVFSTKTNAVFHEIKYEPRQVIASLINNREKILFQKKDTGKLSGELIFLRAVVQTTSDSVFKSHINRSLKIDIDAQELNAFGYNKINNKTTSPLHWVFRDTTYLKTDTLAGNLNMPLQYFTSDVDFFTKYPAFAIWVLLILTFFVTLFIIAAVCWYTIKNASAKITQCIGQVTFKKEFAWHYSITVGILLLFIVAALYVFYDGGIVKNVYFLPCLRTRIIILVLVGYAVGSLCFAGFINTASYLEILQFRQTQILEGKANFTDSIAGSFNECFYLLKRNFDIFFHYCPTKL
jgi:hypothetical protein